MITTQEQYNQLFKNFNLALNANLMVQEELKRELSNTSLNKATGNTWGDSFASLPTVKQLRRVWENVKEARHITGTREDGTLFDFVTKAWDKNDLIKLTQLGKCASMLQDWEDSQEIESLEDYLGLEGVDYSDF